MNLLFLLKLDHPELARAEALAAVHGWGWWARKERARDGLLPVEADRVPGRLGLTREIVRVLQRTTPRRLERALAAIDWDSAIKGTYRVTLTDATGSFSQHALADRIRTKRKADLERPRTVIRIIVTKTQAYVGVRAWLNKEDFQARRAHLWPAPHPSGAHPAVMRALVRLACSDRVHDPCCGAGGTLIEVGLLGCTVSGADIVPAMVARARKNCRAFKVRASLRVADARSWMPRVPAVVTDLPHGQSTTGDASIADDVLANVAARRVVLGLPSAKRFRGWRVRAHFTMYMHRNLTRHYYVLERTVRVVAFGTYDALHPGHRHALREAKRHGDHLTVVVARDATVRAVKGRAPSQLQEERLAAVRGLPSVDAAILGSPGDKHALVEHLDPDVICLGYDQRTFTDGLAKRVPGARIVRLEAFHPERYKSSLMRSRAGTRSPRRRAHTRRPAATLRTRPRRAPSRAAPRRSRGRKRRAR